MLKRFLFVLADHENQEQITTKLKIKVKILRFLFQVKSLVYKKWGG